MHKFNNFKTMTLDSFVKECGIERVDFIKIDAEGSEREILKGASFTFLLYLQGFRMDFSLFSNIVEIVQQPSFAKKRWILSFQSVFWIHGCGNILLHDPPFQAQKDN
jgi:hypothetical protein